MFLFENILGLNFCFFPPPISLLLNQAYSYSTLLVATWPWGKACWSVWRHCSPPPSPRRSKRMSTKCCCALAGYRRDRTAPASLRLSSKQPRVCRVCCAQTGLEPLTDHIWMLQSCWVTSDWFERHLSPWRMRIKHGFWAVWTYMFIKKKNWEYSFV